MAGFQRSDPLASPSPPRVLQAGPAITTYSWADAAGEPPDAPSGRAAFHAGVEHRTGDEWLSRDPAEADACMADPWCGWDVPEDVFPALFAPAPQLADPAQ